VLRVDRQLREPSEAGGDSPLRLLSLDPRTQSLLLRIQKQLDALRAASASARKPPTLTLELADVRHARKQWEAGVLRGERGLYDLATLLAGQLLGTPRFEIVARLVAGPDEKEEGPSRIVIEEMLSPDDLKKATDHTLAGRIARRYQYRTNSGADFGRLYPRASFLEFRPLEAGDEAYVTKLTTRVKINDQIWNKVCDALFEVDRIMQRDKILNKASKYIKDVFGIKLLTNRVADSYLVEEQLARLRFGNKELSRLGVPLESAESLSLLERKDYIAPPPSRRKKTGWQAIKNVYRWRDQVFEVQIQTQANYFLEASHLSNTSHRTFEMQRRKVRRQLEERVMYYGDFRRLLKMLFKPGQLEINPSMPPWLVLE